jgi:hypothetical protein
MTTCSLCAYSMAQSDRKTVELLAVRLELIEAKERVAELEIIVDRQNRRSIEAHNAHKAKLKDANERIRKMAEIMEVQKVKLNAAAGGG